MEFAKVVKYSTSLSSSFPLQQKQLKHPNTPLIHTSKPVPHHSLHRRITHIKSRQNEQNPNGNCESYVPTMAEIMESCRLQNLDVQLEKVGPFFRISAKSLESGRELGRAEGLTRVWFGGKILHLDSMKVQRETIGMKKSIFGVGLFIGAVAIRFGYECGCTKAELLAIKDTDVYHSKLVRFYERLGFNKVYEVTGGSLRDLPHMLVWGGVGTRMDANLQQLMIKWCSKFNPNS